MKFILLIFSLIFISLACSRNNSLLLKNQKKEYYSKPDSILLKTNNGVIYITSDTTFNHYKWLNPSIDVNTEFFNSQIEFFNKKDKLNKFPLNILDKWSQIYIYKNKYFVYSPSDWMSNETLLLTDSVIYHNRSVDPDLEFIKDYSKINDSVYFFNLYSPNYSEQLDFIKRKLTIIVIDKKFMITKWIWTNSDNQILFTRLFVDSRNVKSFPMIVEDCGNQKCFFPNGGVKFDIIK